LRREKKMQNVECGMQNKRQVWFFILHSAFCIPFDGLSVAGGSDADKAIPAGSVTARFVGVPSLSRRFLFRRRARRGA